MHSFPLKHFSPLVAILIFAAGIRLIGIHYGLPLMLVADEPPFTLAALKMLELKTLIPALHPEAFTPFLYYPPYLSYFYILPFTLVIGFAYLTFAGGAEFFIAHLVSDLSPFFIIARLWNVTLGIASVYLAYRVSLALFSSRTAALTTALLLSTSVIHIALSLVARHWMPVSFLTLFALFVLTHEKILSVRRYGYALLIAGIGMGVSPICALILIPITLYFFLLGNLSFLDALKSRFLWFSGIGFIALSIIPSLLYQKSAGFLADITLGAEKTLSSLFTSPYDALSVTLFSEPVLTGACLAGIIVIFFSRSRVCFFASLWFLVYTLVFFLFFRFESRFFLPLVPLYAILGGYALSVLTKRGVIGQCIYIGLLIIPITTGLITSALAYQNDTRNAARNWAFEHLSAEEKVLTFVDSMRLPTTIDAIRELRAIDPSALRKVDEAEETLARDTHAHALNLYTVSNTSFFSTLPEYAQKHGYRYLLLAPSYLAEQDSATRDAFASLLQSGTVIREWHGLGGNTSISSSSFTEPFFHLFSGQSFGPDVVVYMLTP